MKNKMSVYKTIEKLWENQEGNTVCDCVAKAATLQLAREIDLLWDKVKYLLENAIIIEKEKREELKRTLDELESSLLRYAAFEVKKTLEDLRKELREK